MRMVSLMATEKKTSSQRNRTIRWNTDMDELAIQQAVANGYYPERTNGGVSKYLADLVRSAGEGAKSKAVGRLKAQDA